MNEPEQILVYILSAFLALFLGLAIYAAVLLIKVLNAMKHIAEKAESIADRAESIGDLFSKSSGPLAIGKLFMHLADTVFKKDAKRKSRGRDDEY